MHRSLKTPKALNRRGFRSQKSLFFGFTPFRLDFVVSSAMISATNAAFCETTTNGRALATAQEKKYRHEESGLFEPIFCRGEVARRRNATRPFQRLFAAFWAALEATICSNEQKRYFAPLEPRKGCGGKISRFLSLLGPEQRENTSFRRISRCSKRSQTGKQSARIAKSGNLD